MITPESIDRVREAADIVEIVGEHVKLKRAGADFRGPCPFHGGKGPNFSVSPKRNAYHCFVCGVSGDAIGFVREHLGMDFVEAVKYVAARSGVEVKETAYRRDEEADPREPLWEANAAAAEYYREALWSDDDAKGARDYLASRGLGRDEADRFSLGWAPRDGAAFLDRMRALGHDEARLVEAGLLVEREETGERRPRFRGRLMFPIVDAGGRHVAFGGRVIGAGEPKYLNSPETSVFSKGKQLYGLSTAKHPIRKADRVLLVEGYFDAIRLALAGIEEVVAPLGTALTEHQAALLAKLTKNVFLLYDSDKAGLKATFKSGIELLRLGVSARVVTLPEGEDPDTFVRAHGAARMEAQLAQAIDLFDRQIQMLERKGWFAELHRKRSAIDKLLPTLRAAGDPLTRDMYVARLAEVTGVDRDVLLREVTEPPRARAGAPVRPRDEGSGEARSVAEGGERYDGGRGRGRWGGRFASDERQIPPSDTRDGVEFVEPRRDFNNRWEERRPGRARFGDRRTGKGRRTEEWASSDAIARVAPEAPEFRTERELVRALLQERRLVDFVAERRGVEDFQHPIYRTIFEKLVEQPDIDLTELAQQLPEDAVRVVDDLSASPLPDPESWVEGWLKRIQVRAIDRELRALDRQLLGGALTEEEKTELSLRKSALAREREELSPHVNRVGKRTPSELE